LRQATFCLSQKMVALQQKKNKCALRVQTLEILA
jgi:hypothetical protein